MRSSRYSFIHSFSMHAVTHKGRRENIPVLSYIAFRVLQAPPIPPHTGNLRNTSRFILIFVRDRAGGGGVTNINIVFIVYILLSKYIKNGTDSYIYRLRKIVLFALHVSTLMCHHQVRFVTHYLYFFFNFCGGTLGTAATTGLLYQPRVIVMVIVEKLVE
jgi:hypothetical protein